MKRIFLFLILLGAAITVLLLSIGSDPLFPQPKNIAATKQATPDKNRVDTPLITLDQKKGAIEFQLRDNIDFKSSRQLVLANGKTAQVVRFRLQAKKAIPRRRQLYTLKEARITFFDNSYPPRPELVIEANRLIMETLTGMGEFKPRLDQKMLLNGVVIHTGSSFSNGSLHLKTAKLAIDLSGDKVLFETPDKKMPFTLEGKIGQGELTIKGRGVSGLLPPLDLKENKAGSTDRNFFHLEFLEQIDGRWLRGVLTEKPMLIKFTCRKTMVVEKHPGKEHQFLTLNDQVRVTGIEAENKGRLLADTLTLRLAPDHSPSTDGTASKGSYLEKLTARGNRVLLSSANGELLAQEVLVRLTPTTHLQHLVAKGLKRLTGNTPDNGHFLAQGFPELVIVGFWNQIDHLASLCPILNFTGRQPGYLVRLKKSGLLQLQNQNKKTVSLQITTGLDVLFNREQKPMRAASSGQVDMESIKLNASSDLGFLVALPHLPHGKATLDLAPPGDGPAVTYSITDKRSATEGFSLVGRGRASIATNRWSGEDKEDLLVKARACGPHSFLHAQTSSATETVKINHIGHLELVRRLNQSRIKAYAGPFKRLAVNTVNRRFTAWGDHLDIQLNHADGLGTAYFHGLEENQVLVVTASERKPTDKRGGTEIRLLSPRLVVDLVGGSNKTARLRTDGGFRLRTGSLVLPARKMATTKTIIPELIDDLPLQTLYVSGGLFRLEREKVDGPEVVRMFNNIKLFGQHTNGTLRGKGEYLWISPVKKHAIMLGKSASIVLHRQDGSGRTMEITSELIDFTAEKIVAGDLASGLGGQVLISSSRDYLGRKTNKRGVIQAACGMPIHIQRDRLVFTGITTMSQAQHTFDGHLKRSPSSPVLVCGEMVCYLRPRGPAVFDKLIAREGFRVKLFRNGQESMIGKGGQLSFLLDQGLLLMDGMNSPCELFLGNHLTQGSKIDFNIRDYTWKIHRFRCHSKAKNSKKL